MSRGISLPSRIELDEAFQTSIDKHPDPKTWGFYARSDGPPWVACAGGFCWFDSLEGLIQFLHDFPLLGQSAVEEVPDENILTRIDGVRAELTKVRDSASLDQRTIDSINEHLSGIEQILWIGQFEELLSGNHSFAVELREGMYEERNDPEVTSRPIDQELVDEFVDYLKDYGA